MKKIFLSIIVLLSVSGSLCAQEELTLENAIATALKYNYGVILSQLDTQIAAENNSWGAAGALPTLTTDGGYYIDKELIGSSKEFTNTGYIDVDADIVLFNGYRIRLTKKINEYKYDLSKGIEVVQIENCISDVTLAYYTVILETKIRNISRQVYILSKDRFERDQSAVDLGGKGTYELIQSESAYLADYQRFLAQEKSVGHAVYALNLVMGIDIDTKWTIPIDMPIPTEDYVLGDLTDKMINNNFTLANQYLNQRVLEEGISYAKGDFMPKITASVGMGYSNAKSRYNSSSSRSESFDPTAGVYFSATLFAGKEKQRNITIANVNAKMGEVSIDQMKQSLTSTLFTEYDNYMYNKKIYALSNREVKVAGINLKLSKERYNKGLITSFDYRDVQIAYLSATYSNLEIIYNLVKSNLELCRLTGGLVDKR